MTTAEHLRVLGDIWKTGSPRNELCSKAATELDQRDDTIAQLRAERDHFRELLRRCEWTSNRERIRCAFCDSPITEGHRGGCILEAALKGETSENR